MSLKEEGRCPDCLAWHGIGMLKHLKPGVPCGHDKERSCTLCGHPVGGLSMGGPGICSWCDCGMPPEATLAERRQEAEAAARHWHKYEALNQGIKS